MTDTRLRAKDLRRTSALCISKIRPLSRQLDPASCLLSASTTIRVFEADPGRRAGRRRSLSTVGETSGREAPQRSCRIGVFDFD